MMEESLFEPGVFLAAIFGVVLVYWFAAHEFVVESIRERRNIQSRMLSDLRVRNIMSKADRILAEHVLYYRLLSSEGRKRFRSRVAMLLATKLFVPRNGVELDDEKLLLIISGLVQLTFGLEEYELSLFQTIEIYPDTFEQGFARRDYLGNTSTSGRVRLSWKHVLDGIRITDDALNLVLHEFAHAFMISVEESNIGGSQRYRYMQAYLGHLEAIKGQVESMSERVFRKYAITNEAEFFACGVEVFFENPEGFATAHKELYALLTQVLQQDPRNTTKDFRLEQDAYTTGVLEKVKRKILPASDRSHRYIPAMIICGMITWPICVFLARETTSDSLMLWLFFISITMVGYMLFYRKMILTQYTDMPIFIIFLVVGWLPNTGLVALGLNRAIPVYYVVQDFPFVYTVQRTSRGADINTSIPGISGHHVTISDQQMEELFTTQPEFVMRVTQYYGLFGLAQFESAELVLQSAR